MSPERRQRFAFFALALLLHGIVFYLVARLVVFTASAPGDNISEFQRIALPTRTVAPPSMPMPPVPNISLPTPPPVVVAPITTTLPSSFTLPKVDITAIMDKTLNRPDNQHSAPTTPSNAVNNADNSLGSADAPSTASFAVMNNAFKGDSRDGAIVALFYPGFHPEKDFDTLHAIGDKLPEVSWVLGSTAFEIGKPTYYLEKIIKPDHRAHRDYYRNARPEEETHDIVYHFTHEIAPYLTSTNVKIKTFVLTSNFEDNFINPQYLRPNAEQIQRIVDEQTRVSQDLITYLRSQNIRLCIVSCHCPPYSDLAAYVKESGGIILYPDGVPPDQAANQLMEVATTPQK